MELDSNHETTPNPQQNNTDVGNTHETNNETLNTRTKERFQTELIMAEMDVLEKEVSLKTSEVNDLKKQISLGVKKEKDFKTAANQSFTKAHKLYRKVVIINKSLQEKIKNLEKSFSLIENEKKEILSSFETAEKDNLALQAKLNEIEQANRSKIDELNLQIKKLTDESNDKQEYIIKLQKKNKNALESNNELVKANNVLKNDLKELTNLTSEILEGKNGNNSL